ncbi:MAG: energy-coupling factor transporter transmembrane protein EcfT [Peptococcaceae bacterium]|nr:energy-coupling factor transporter transmembrane protein EcfT [Peptococcaceae bacterium]
MELARNITFGQYVDRDSVVHRLDPRLKILLLCALIVYLFFIHTFTGYFVLMGFLFIAVRLAKLSIPYVLKGLKPMILFLVFVWVFQVLFYARPNITDGPIWWQWGLLSISAVGLRTATLLMVRVILLFLTITMLTFTTDLVDLGDGAEHLMKPLQRIGVPVNELVMVFVIAVRFVPTLIEELERLMKAQTARGADFETGNFLVRTRRIIPVLVPLFVNSFKRAEELILAMESRCYTGGKGRTKRRSLSFKRRDLYTALLMLGLFAFMHFVVGRVPPPY